MVDTGKALRHYADAFRYTNSGVRWSDLTDEQLLQHDPSRAAQLAPPPVVDEPAEGEQQPPPP